MRGSKMEENMVRIRTFDTESTEFYIDVESLAEESRKNNRRNIR